MELPFILFLIPVAIVGVVLLVIPLSRRIAQKQTKIMMRRQSVRTLFTSSGLLSSPLFLQRLSAAVVANDDEPSVLALLRQLHSAIADTASSKSSRNKKVIETFLSLARTQGLAGLSQVDIINVFPELAS